MSNKKIGRNGKYVHYVINSNVPSNVPFNRTSNAPLHKEGEKID